jgi:hypothetical protein
MTSTLWPQAINVSGLFSTDPVNNPDFYNFNAAYLPYCTSDTWSGNADINQTGPWYFLGKNVLTAVIQDLMMFGLDEAEQVLWYI